MRLCPDAITLNAKFTIKVVIPFENLGCQSLETLWPLVMTKKLTSRGNTFNHISAWSADTNKAFWICWDGDRLKHLDLKVRRLSHQHAKQIDLLELFFACSLRRSSTIWLKKQRRAVAAFLLRQGNPSRRKLVALEIATKKTDWVAAGQCNYFVRAAEALSFFQVNFGHSDVTDLNVVKTSTAVKIAYFGHDEFK